MTAIYVNLPARGIISVSGTEAADLLQRIITNDMDLVTEERAIYAALLTPQGKYLYDFFVLGRGDGYLLDCNGHQVESLLKRLKMYRLRADVELADVSAEYQVLAIYDGDQRPLGGGVYNDPRADKMGQRAILPVGDDVSWGEEGEFAAYDRRRISLAIPNSTDDLIPEKSTPLELNFEELHAIDFDKGCYVGQEVTARMKHRATLRKRLLAVSFDGAAPASGTAIKIGDREVGTMGSSAGQIGLALLRLDRLAEGGQPTADGIALDVKPFN
jgi:folate-binding protein YgfZ